jgi:uncharacterized OB-fold protein
MLVSPLPDPSDRLTRDFWTAARGSRLVVQRCPDCGYLRWPPGPVCPECLRPGGDWAEITPAGVLYSYTTYHRSLSAALKADVPYSVGLVELDDGPRMYGRLLDQPDELAVGSRVGGVFEPVTDEVSLLCWRREEQREEQRERLTP